MHCYLSPFLVIVVVVGVPPPPQPACSWRRRWIGYIWSSKTQGHSRLAETCGQTSAFWGHFLTYLQIAWTCQMKLVIITHYWLHMTLTTLLARSWVTISRSRTAFSENSLFLRRHIDWRFALETFCFFGTLFRTCKMLCHCQHLAMSNKPLVLISPNLWLSCSWGQIWTDLILRSKGQRSHWDLISFHS